MEPVGQSSGTSTSTRCIETKSKCVIWDGPDIDCLGVRLCKGQSIEVIVYHTANALCLLLESLNISNVDLACLTPPADVEGPSNIVELSELIITKLCELNDAVETLENTGAQDIIVPLPDCDAIIANCPANITTQYVDGTGATVTGLLLISADGQTSPAVEYFAGLICELLCRMSTLETRVDDLRTDVDNLINQIAGALPPVQLPCDKINGIGLGINQQIVNPDDPTEGVIPDIAEKVCDIITELTGNSDITTLNSYPDISPFVDCLTTLSTAAPVGVYPGMGVPPVTLADLGAYANPQNLREIMSNAWVAICDLRNFAEIVKASCCPTYCASIEYELGASLPPLDGTRETIRIILSGSFVNFYGGTISANSVVPAPGLGAGAPNTYDGATPFVVTITDQSLNSVVFNEPSVESLFTPGNFFDATGLVPPLNPLEDYTVSICSIAHHRFYDYDLVEYGNGSS